MPEKLLLKVIVAGEPGVGKSTYLRRITMGEYVPQYLSNIGIDVYPKELSFEGTRVFFQIWEAPARRFLYMTLKPSLKGTKGILLLYDLTQVATLDALREWIKAFRGENLKVPWLLVGTKSDLVDMRQVNQNHIQSFAQEIDACGTVEVSAKTGNNIERSLELLTLGIRKRQPS